MRKSPHDITNNPAKGKSRRRSTRGTQPGQLSLLTLALATALATMTPTHAMGDTIVSGSQSGISNTQSQNITITSTGAISGSNHTAIINNGTIGTLSNSGSISGNYYTGIINIGTIGTLSNSGFISGYYGIINDGTIDTLSNSGSISGSNYYAGIINNGTIDTLSNSGFISGYNGIYNGGTISTLSNSGSISGNHTGICIYNGRTIGSLNNSGLITGSVAAIYLYSGSTISHFTNAGTIAGAIDDYSGTGLTINGGTGTIFGTLTGVSGSISASAIGSIVSSTNLTFGSGNQLLNDNITVNSGSGTVTNAGMLQVNNPLTITGNYAQAAGATLLIGVSSGATFSTGLTDTGYGRLVVNGNAVIASGSAITLKTLGYSFAQGQRYVVVAANGSSTNYNASSLVYSATGYTVTASVQADSGNSTYSDLVLTLGSTSTSGDSSSTTPNNNATSSNAASALSGLFKYSGTDAALLAVFNPAAALDTAAAANKAGAQLSPAATANAVVSASTAAFGAVQGAAGNRLDTVRTAQAGSSGVATGETSLDPAVWGRIFGGQANQGERDGISGYHANYGGFMLGGDVQALPDWRVGGLFSYAHTNVGNDGDNSGSGASVNAYGLTAYAGFDGHPWYLNLTAGVARQMYSTTRTISYTGFSGIANGSFKGSVYSTAAEAGYPLAVGDATLTPLAGMHYSALKQDGYTETGGSGAALVVNGSSYTSLKSEVGAKVERTLATGYGELKPFVQLSWNHEFRDTALTTSASFAADTSGTTAFTTQGASPLRNTAQLSLGATLLQSKNLMLSARYTLEGVKGYTAQTGDLTLRWQY